MEFKSTLVLVRISLLVLNIVVALVDTKFVENLISCQSSMASFKFTCLAIELYVNDLEFLFLRR